MAKRKRTPQETETHILVQSARRCCLCFGLNNDFGEKRGQIAHLDRKPSNANLDNLAYLCLEHHDLYDSRRSQSKGLTIQEVKHYRSMLYDEVSNLRANTDIKEASIPKGNSGQTVRLLPRLKTGKELVDVVADYHSYYHIHDEPTTEMEANLIGNFLQHIEDFCDDLSSAGPKMRIETALYFNSRILELEENKFKIFGKREVEEKEIHGMYGVWITSYVSVIRSTNPTIIDLEEVRNITNQEIISKENEADLRDYS